jgi:broad specificity phosphatase PhoE
LVELTRQAKCVCTSPLRRSRESAALLAPGITTLMDADFREAELPCGFRSGLRLPPHLWGLVARSAWCCGWSTGVETFAAARQRAAQAAALLRARAARDGLVVLVGHGFLNILIAQHLRAAGWRGPRLPSQRHWGFAVYSL